MPIKISQMTSAASLTGDEIVPLVQSGGNVRSTVGALTTFVTPFFNWKSYGAIGDGASHPLSTRYATLALAQAVYSFATSLGQEIDFCAIQKSINAANAAGGGYSFGHPGTYRTGNDTITMQRFVTLQGSGKRATIIQYDGTAHAILKTERVNSSVAVHTAARDFGVTMTNPASTGACYVDIGGTFVEIENIACNAGKFGVIFDQTELATIRLNDFEGQLSAGAGVWMTNGPGNTPSVTFTVAPAAGATSGTLNANWTLATGTYNLDFVETVGGAHESRMATLTNGSSAASWVGGLSAACNATTTAAAGQFTNRIRITENQFNNNTSSLHIVDDGGVNHTISDNNFNSSIISATPPCVRVAGMVAFNFIGNEMEGGQTFLRFENLTNYDGAAAGQTISANIIGNTFSQSTANTPIVLAVGANPLVLMGNWFGGSAAAKVTGTGFNICNTSLGNVWNSGTLFDFPSGPAVYFQTDSTSTTGSGYLSTSGKSGYTVGGGGTVTQLVDKTTGVTSNKPNGEIILNNAALGANTTVSFTLTNSTIAANDVVDVIHKRVGTAGAYLVWACFPLAGSCTIFVRNITAGSLSEAIVLQFSVVAGSIS